MSEPLAEPRPLACEIWQPQPEAVEGIAVVPGRKLEPKAISEPK